MTSHIGTLVQQLDGKADESYDAHAELIRIGADAIPAVINGLPSLGGFGQLTAWDTSATPATPRRTAPLDGPRLRIRQRLDPLLNSLAQPRRHWR